jgi:hypothetical protein
MSMPVMFAAGGYEMLDDPDAKSHEFCPCWPWDLSLPRLLAGLQSDGSSVT